MPTKYYFYNIFCNEKVYSEGVEVAKIHSHPYRADSWNPSWDDIGSKPSTFTPSTHTHFAYVDKTTNQTIGGDKTFSNDVTAPDFIMNSDRELKTNIKPITGKNLVLHLKPVMYNWKEGDTESINPGFIAQEVEKVVPSLVSKMQNGLKGVKYAKITALNTAAIQALSAENTALRRALKYPWFIRIFLEY